MGKIRWTEKAGKNLEAIHDYIARDSHVYARRFIKALIEATGKLQTMPCCGRIVPEFEMLGFRELIFQNYRIVYRIRDASEEIDILSVVHGGREMENMLDENET